MASEVGICNSALQLIKNTKYISSLTQGGKEADACEDTYPELRDFILEHHDWNFARRRVVLSRLGDTYAPAFGFTYAYSLPSDLLSMRGLFANSRGTGDVEFSREGAQINTDAEDLYLLYTARVADPNLMSASFRQALAKLLSSRLASALNNNVSLSQALYNQYLDEDLPSAQGVDSIQQRPQQRPESSWVSVRESAQDTRHLNGGWSS